MLKGESFLEKKQEKISIDTQKLVLTNLSKVFRQRTGTFLLNVQKASKKLPEMKTPSKKPKDK